MTSIGSAKADQLEALISTIENATSLQTRLVIRNSEAWIASATQQIVATETIDQAAQEALAAAVKFGEHLPYAMDDTAVLADGTTGFAIESVPADDIEELRHAALSSIRAFQTTLLDAAPNDSGRVSFHC